MSNISSKLNAYLVGVLYGLLCTTSCFAATYTEDTNRGDTDIFFGGGSGQTLKPNVLFVLDNSGSMDNIIKSSGKSRMQTMKESFRSIMSTTQGINVGIMRFNDPGGSILYPVTDIDQSISSFEPTLNPQSKNSADDATEAKSGADSSSDGSVDLTSTELTLGWAPGTAGKPATSQIRSSADDAYEYDTTAVNLKEKQQLCDDCENRTQYMGMRFQTISIPPGSRINSAYIQMTSRLDTNSDAKVKIRAEATAPKEFTSTNYDISGRVYNVVPGQVTWEISNGWVTDQEYKTNDLTALVQQLINQGSWVAGGNMSFIFERQVGSRYIYGYDDNSSKAPKLVIDFSPPSTESVVTLPIKKVAGVRFQDVGVPQGATITSAYILFTPSQTSTDGENFSANIKIENSDNAAAFAATRGNITARNTVSVQTWDINEVWEQDKVVQTPDLSAIIQPIINSSGWCGNNALAFTLEENAGVLYRRKMFSVDAPGSNEPKLIIKYKTESVTSSNCINQILDGQIMARPDDAYQSGSTVDNDSPTLILGNNNTVGLRFDRIPIKKGSTILEASLELTSTSTDATNSSWTIKAEKIANSYGIPESNNVLSGMTKTTASVNWNSSTSPALNNWDTTGEYTSPDIKSVIQEIVNQSGWQANNAFTLLINGSGNRTTYAWDGSSGGAAKLHIKVRHGGIDSTKYTVREHVVGLVNALQSNTWTPIVDTLYEAALYYKGDPIYYAKKRDGSSDTEARYQRVSDEKSYTGGTYYAPNGCSPSNLDSKNCAGEKISGSPVYISPIEDTCQHNYMVLLTDGIANNNHSQSLIKNLIGAANCDTSYASGERCSPELVSWLYNNDVNTKVSGPKVPGGNRVTTYTIAFALDDKGAKNYLKKLADKGGDPQKNRAYTAENAADLSSVFNDILSDILAFDTTFVTPGTTVNQFSRLTNGNDVYYSVFRPDKSTSWDGNLKKYQMKDGKLVDQNGDAAIETDAKAANVGFFKTTAKSLWSNTVDGSAVNMGGAASKLGSPADRKVYTYYAGASYNLKENLLNYSSSAFKTKISTIYNESVNKTYTDTYVKKLVDWTRGMDVDDKDLDGIRTEARLTLGDPLHSSPVSLTYGGNATAPDSTLFVATNQGMLHAFDADNGTELFAFMPGEFLSKIEKFYQNAQQAHIYGLDGQITPHIIDYNGDGIISGNDKVYLYIGMGRGGNKFYAIDVTDRTNPQLLWIIDGDDTTNFPELGESWSQATFGFVKINDAKTPVIIIGAGYQKEHDTRTTLQPNTQGNAIYMIEARPNANHKPVLLWTANKTKFPEMLYSISAKVDVADLDADGLLDQMYVGDLGGQLWRFDIANGLSQSEMIKGGVILNVSGLTSNTNRRFYNTPDVVFLTQSSASYLAVSLGTGWRGNPLDQSVHDQFYSVRQEINPPASYKYTKLTQADLFNATDDLVLKRFTDLKTTEAAAESKIEAYTATIATLKEQKANTSVESEITQIQASIDRYQTMIDAEVAKVETAKNALKAERSKYQKGWYVDFSSLQHPGEKVLAKSITLDGKIIFTTYQPVSAGSSCKAAEGVGRVYALGIFDASAVVDFDGDGVPDRSRDLLGYTIPPDPMIFIESSSDPSKPVTPRLCFGTECGYDFGAEGALSKGTYWLEREDLR